MKPWNIYGLKDPTTNSINYIGCTQLSIQTRLYHHWRDRNQPKNKHNFKAHWVKNLYEKHKLKPTVFLIEIFHAKDTKKVLEREIFWIDYYIKLGEPLTNTSGKNYVIIHKTHNKNRHMKPVYCYDKNYKLCIFESGRAAQKALNVSHKNISAMITRKRGSETIPFVFSFDKLTKSEIKDYFKPKVIRKPIIGTNVVTGKCIIFKSQFAAAKKLNCNFRNINLVLKGRRNSCGGYYWKYQN